MTFRYDSNRPVLRELCLQVAPGEAVAVIGRSGAGKSTLLSLIPRLAEPESGDVLVDGTDVRDLQLRSLRQNVSFLFQDPHLWRRTVAENIAYGCEEASRNDIIDAARWAKADGFISRLPSGYDSMIGERGATLSGGERQRIALARAFLKNAPILLLDEPTAACDAETEAELTAAFRALARHRTTLIVAHRLSTVGWVDRVVVLEDGHIVETGSPQQLLKQGGAFQRWHRLQMSGIREEASV